MIRYPIFLIGYMTSGKSSIGKKVAKKLAVDFLDLDKFIEEQEQLSISNIFQEKGEPYFRRKESQALQLIEPGLKKVIALGGGAACNKINLDYILAVGTSIYLKVPSEILIGRLKAKKGKRPLVATLNDDALSSFVNEQLKQREVFYQQANIIFPSSTKPKANEIVKALSLLTEPEKKKK